MTNHSDAVLYEVVDRVALITLNRPETLNAWSPDMHIGYFTSLDRADDDGDVRVVVVTGAGRGFCSGADVSVLAGEVTGDEESAPPSDRTWTHTHAMSIRKPVIAAINGGCAGLGFVHAMACDLRFAASGAKITSAFSRRGLIAEYGVSWILPRVVGRSTALDILLSGRVFLAEEAKEMGVVDRVWPRDELIDRTMDYARDLAVHASPASMAAIKDQVQHHAGLDLEAALRDTADRMRSDVSQADVREGVRAFIERRAPNFAPLHSPGSGGTDRTAPHDSTEER